MAIKNLWFGPVAISDSSKENLGLNKKKKKKNLICEFFRQLKQWVSDLCCRLSLYSLYRNSYFLDILFQSFRALALGMSKMNSHIVSSTSNYFTTYCYNYDVTEVEKKL